MAVLKRIYVSIENVYRNKKTNSLAINTWQNENFHNFSHLSLHECVCLLVCASMCVYTYTCNIGILSPKCRILEKGRKTTLEMLVELRMVGSCI